MTTRTASGPPSRATGRDSSASHSPAWPATTRTATLPCAGRSPWFAAARSPASTPQRYAWAEPAIQEMVSAIVDVAHELSSRRCEAGGCTGALWWSARQGLLGAEEREMLHRQVFLAHHAAGDIDALRAAAARLARINEQLGGGVDMEAQTAELLRNLLPRTVTGPGEGRRNNGRCLAAQLGLLQATARIPMPPSRTSRQQRGHPFPQVIRRPLGRHPKDPAETTPNCQVPQRTSLQKPRVKPQAADIKSGKLCPLNQKAGTVVQCSLALFSFKW